MTDNCPCCGQGLPEMKRPLVDLSMRTIAFNGRSAKVSPQQAVMLDLLVRRMPNPVPYDALILTVWQDEEPEFARNAVSVRVCQLRPLLADMGLALVTVWGVGLRLVEADSTRRANAAA